MFFSGKRNFHYIVQDSACVFLKICDNMFGKDISQQKLKSSIWISTALFVILAVLYFVPADIPFKNVFPVASLAVFSLWLDPLPVSIALMLSAAGDLMAATGSFMGQMECFAVAHLFLTLFFIQRLFRTGRASTKNFSSILTQKRMAYIVLNGICVAVILILAIVTLVPETPEGVVRAGVAFYAVVISLMLFSALLQRSILYALAAVLFVISDFVLAWNKFVEPVPYETFLIMIPYFAAEWCFFVRATKYRVGKSLLVNRI